MSSTAPPEPTVPPPSQEEEGHLLRVLGTPSLVLFGLVYMVPLTVFTTYGIVTETTGGRLSVAYLVTLAAMVFTARSYARMAAAYPVAGSAYTYTQRSFGAPIGFLAGWSLLLDYLFLPMLNYLVIGLYLNAAIPAIPEWVIVVVTIAIVTVLNIVGIVSVDRANFVIIAVQAVFIVVFIIMACVTLSHTGSVDFMAPLRGDGTAPGFSPILAGAAILCLSFLGFDAVSTLSEEAKDPKRTVPRAIMIATIASGIIFIILSFISQLVFPSNKFADVDSGSLDVMTTAGGHFLNAFFTAAYVAGALGSAITSQASVARILYAMGRDGILPRRIFGYVAARFSTPVYAILVVSVISLLAIVIGLDILAQVVSFGALVAFSAVNLTVVKHYFVDAGDKNVFNNVVLPVIGFLLTVWLWTSLSGLALTIGLIWLGLASSGCWW
jgi:amino acid transporter